MQTLYLSLSALPSPYALSSKPTKKNKPFLCSFSLVSSLAHSPSISTPTSLIKKKPPTPNATLFNFLIKTLDISEPKALSIANRFSSSKSHEKVLCVVRFLKELGFSDDHIRSSILCRPHILFSDVDKTLRPKVQFLQELGLTGPDLGNFISSHSHFLACSLEKRLIPYVDVIKKTLVEDENNQDLIRILQGTYREVPKSVSRLNCNIAFLESCGIVGSNLSMLLMREPRLFFLPEPDLRDLILRVLDMGFSVGSTMFVYAVRTVIRMSRETFSRKIELFRDFGISEDECMGMFRKNPTLLANSEDKLKFKIDLFLNDFKLDRCALVSWPHCLTYSTEKRVIPRYRVIRHIMSKRLLQKEPSFRYLLTCSEEKFIGKFILRFPDLAEEILKIYKGELLDY